MNVTKKQAYIIGGIALVGLGIGAYFLFKKENGEYDETQENLPEITVDKTGVKVKGTPEYRNELSKYAKSKEIQDTTYALLTLMNKNIGRNREEIKSLIFDRIPSDDHMKILKAYFHCHRYTGRWFSNNCWDLTNWLRDVFGNGDEWSALTLKYPSLQIPRVCSCKSK